MLPILLVYGNCQAEAICTILDRTRLTEFFEIAYLRSFEHPALGRATLPDEILERCAMVWEQHDYEPFPYAERLANRAPATVFPSIDLNVLWPHTCNNPYNRPQPPEHPFGPFHYGDRNVVAGIRAGLDAESVLDRALRAWDERTVDLDRLLEIERARLLTRDLHCDVRMADRILGRFSRERCFFTRDHPTISMLFEVIEALVARSCAYEPRLTLLQLGDDVRAHFPNEPLGEASVPIHPMVAEHFGLEWYQPVDIRDYYEAMIRYGISIRDECTP